MANYGVHVVLGTCMLSIVPMHTTYVYLRRSEVLECFRRRELLEWTAFQMSYEEVLRAGLPDCPATDVFVTDTELGREQWEDLRKRVIEHVG